MTPRPMTRSARSGPTGLPAWLVQRASALYLLLFVVFLLGFFVVHPLHSYAEWKSWVARPAITLALAVFFAALLSHMWVGLRDVLLDYARPAGLQKTLLWLVALGLCACAVSVAWLLAIQHA
ncbi:succinate dehydrogenase, hydrophobic membrane anchor protein [Simplicispira psychrophila]|uniref:succinate dehydrogenase, hydrophobic membrane anchor protein n=1 Tax=Simplicispira psychrophila TaxID=80882 RepID=UPI000A02986D|nr:succinate dehydrogenase, hydrophobic membrane anchor protein [Simplicispira psychrophila]